MIWAAAIFILGVLFSWAANSYLRSGFHGEIQGCVVTTPLGAKSNVTLPDGTRVILNAGSTLKYPGNFGENTREVTLEGEAYFEVTKNKSKQFQVHTSDITVKAYGTKFNVKSYGEDKTIETTLIEGSVGVIKNKDFGRKHEELILSPQEQLVFYKASSQMDKLKNDSDKSMEQGENKTGKLELQAEPREQTNEKIMISKGIDPLLFTSWTQDRLILKSEPMQKMAISIERKYNIKIHFEDADIKDFRFTGTIENETLENLLAAISIASPVEYTVKDRDIWLRKKIVHDKSHSTQN
jgi:ferric-dicitrate binding protein FerR (iron transport regulator)